MQTHTITTYSFDELNEDAQRRALEKLYDVNIFDDWYDAVYEDAITCGAILGIDIDRIYFSGFSSQGDGACFEGGYTYAKQSVKAIKQHAPLDTELHAIAERLRDIQRPYFYSLYASVKQRGHYMHEMCTDIEVHNDDCEVSDDTEESLKDALRDFMRWIYSSLNDEHDYLTSEEAIIETITANEYEFTELGSLA